MSDHPHLLGVLGVPQHVPQQHVDAGQIHPNRMLVRVRVHVAILEFDQRARDDVLQQEFTGTWLVQRIQRHPIDAVRDDQRERNISNHIISFRPGQMLVPQRPELFGRWSVHFRQRIQPQQGAQIGQNGFAHVIPVQGRGQQQHFIFRRCTTTNERWGGRW
uniref:(northern house mosquito) hypothetical protein n=1 Tax=Culex pipiens TaxID=7175 RepID=A0A8D8AUM9_CULPI